ncbi:uncharacterized protein LOC143300491 [Babylonia areolata]|uniref:uncharacterized protein LOC143300491 n=1 Tax=Babylonia areolata TaxID=304850 RepID=UPI003FD63461
MNVVRAASRRLKFRGMRVALSVTSRPVAMPVKGWVWASPIPASSLGSEWRHLSTRPFLQRPAAHKLANLLVTYHKADRNCSLLSEGGSHGNGSATGSAAVSNRRSPDKADHDFWVDNQRREADSNDSASNGRDMTRLLHSPVQAHNTDGATSGTGTRGERLTRAPASLGGSGDAMPTSARPLAVLFPGIGMSNRVMEKYCQVYLRLGVDVTYLSRGMNVPTCFVPHLIPLVTTPIRRLLQDQSTEFANRPLLLHCISGGLAFAGCMLMNPSERHTQVLPSDLAQDTDLTNGERASSSPPDSRPLNLPQPPPQDLEKRSGTSEVADLRNRVAGVILDSPVLHVDYYRYGIPLLSTTFPPLRSACKLYFSLIAGAFDSTVNPYLRSVFTLDKSPKLILYPDADTFNPVSVLETFLREEEARGSRVNVQSFQGIDHVKILKDRPVRYQEEIRQFLKALGVVGVN